MAYYIKANPKVVQHLGLTNDRNRTQDGNYLLFQADVTVFGPLFQLDKICTEIGAIKLTGQQTMEEQRGIECRPLPVATDPRFAVEPPQTEEEAPETEPETPEVTSEAEVEAEPKAEAEVEEEPKAEAEVEVEPEVEPETETEP